MLSLLLLSSSRDSEKRFPVGGAVLETGLTTSNSFEASVVLVSLLVTTTGYALVFETAFGRSTAGTYLVYTGAGVTPTALTSFLDDPNHEKSPIGNSSSVVSLVRLFTL